MERVREPIRVAVVFGPGQQIKPVWFEWRRRKHTICRTTYRWADQIGENTRLHFAVSDGEALFELVYTTTDQCWTLFCLQPEPA